MWQKHPNALRSKVFATSAATSAATSILGIGINMFIQRMFIEGLQEPAVSARRR